jgi:hypothetical protein
MRKRGWQNIASTKLEDKERKNRKDAKEETIR